MENVRRILLPSVDYIERCVLKHKKEIVHLSVVTFILFVVSGGISSGSMGRKLHLSLSLLSPLVLCL